MVKKKNEIYEFLSGRKYTARFKSNKYNFRRNYFKFNSITEFHSNNFSLLREKLNNEKKIHFFLKTNNKLN